MATDSTHRFSNRVEDYVKCRPAYPVGIITYLRDQFGLTADKIVADIGSGTGISTELFLRAGNKLIAIEPNREMREKAAVVLREFQQLILLDATAEETSLPDHSIDAIVSGQAFHWFDRNKVRMEFQRIIKPGGIVVLMWNERETKTKFEQQYDELIIRHAIDYVTVDHRNITQVDIEEYFDPNPCSLKVFDNFQVFDFEGVTGRLLSSSYMPKPGDKGYDAMLHDLKALFDQYKENELIRINYTTKVYVGRL